MGGLLKSKKSTTQKDVVNLPGWLEGPLKDVIARGTDLSNTPYEAYEGQRLADLSPDELRAMDLIRLSVGDTGRDIGTALNATSEVINRGLNGFSQETLQPYMNPYLNNVLEATKRSQFENFDRNMNDYRSRAAQASAFGGSRFGLGEAQMQKNFEQGLTDYENKARAQAFQSALGQAIGGTTLAGQAAQQYAGLAQNRQKSNFADISALTRVGQANRTQEQSLLDLAYQEYLNKKEYPYKQVDYLNRLVMPASQLMAGHTSTTTTRSKMSPMQAITGLTAAVMGAGGGSLDSLFGGGGSGSSLGGFHSSIGAGGGINVTNPQGLTYITGPGGTTSGMSNLNSIYGFKEGGSVTIVPPKKPISQPNEKALKVFYTSLEKEKGLPNNLLLAMREIESAGGKYQFNDKTSARGPFQILKGSLETYGIPEDTPYLRFDPLVSGKGTSIVAEKNAKTLEKALGRKPTGAELYLAHQQGATGALKLLLNPNEKAYKVRSKKVILNNGGTLDMTSKDFIKLFTNRYSKALNKVNKYANGGLIESGTSFQNDLNKYFRKPLRNALTTGFENLLWHEINAGKNISRGLDYFQRPTEQGPSKETSMLDKLKQEVELDNATNRLNRDQIPVKQLNLEQQASRLANDPSKANIEGFLNSEGYLSERPVTSKVLQKVYPQQKKIEHQQQQEQQEAPIDFKKQALEEFRDSYKGPVSGRKDEEKKGGINYPLLAFGAALLSADPSKAPINALGDAIQAAVGTQLGLVSTKEEGIREKAKQALAERKADLYGKQVEAQLLAAQNPYTQQLEALKLAKLAKDLEKDPTKERMLQEYTKTLMEYNNYTPEKAVQKAMEMVNAQQQQQQQQNQPPVIDALDFFNIEPVEE